MSNKSKVLPMPIVGILSINGISILGNSITEIAIPWLILEMTNSPLLVGLVMTTKVASILVSLLIGSTLVDRYGGLRISLVSDLVNFACILLIPLLYSVDSLSFLLLAFLLAFSTVLDSPGRLAKDFILMKEIKKTNAKNETVNGINTTIENMGDLLGPVLASVLISTIGTVQALYFDAFSFLCASFGILFFYKHFVNGNEKTVNSETGHLQYFKDGVRFVLSSRTLSSLLVISCLVNAIITPLLIIYLPFYNKNVFESVISYGFSVAMFGLGTTLSSALYSFFGDRLKIASLILFSYSSLTVFLMLLPFAGNQVIFFILLFGVGLSIGFAGPVEVTEIQKTTPELLFSRVMTFFTSMRYLAVPFGYLIFGYLMETMVALKVPIAMSLLVICGLLIFRYRVTLGNKITE